MRTLPKGWQLATACLLAFGALKADQPKPAAERPTLPWANAKAMAEAHFAQLALLPTDLISRSEVESLLKAYQRSGWKVAESQELLARVPADNSFLVQLMRQPSSLKFMRHVGGYPDGYDRVERISRMPHGKTILRDLAQNPGGYEMIQYMTESKWGRNLGKQLSQSPKGRDFNAPTGQIYTWPALIEELSARYDEAAVGKRPTEPTFD